MLDDSPFDQDESRALNAVRDVMLSCRISGFGRLQLHAQYGDHTFRVAWDSNSGEGVLLHDEVEVVLLQSPPRGYLRAAELDWVLADQRVLLALDGQVMADYAYEPTNQDARAFVKSMALAAEEGELDVDHLQILRDIYYTAGPTEAGSEYRLGPDEYFLLGDDSPNSRDSRHWIARAVTRQQIEGRVLAW
jgi:hypothetical protein